MISSVTAQAPATVIAFFVDHAKTKHHQGKAPKISPKTSHDYTHGLKQKKDAQNYEKITQHHINEY
jgi:hypothetical protein